MNYRISNGLQVGKNMTSQGSLTPPKPKEHGAWGMLYIPFMISIGITRIFDLGTLLLLLAVTFAFLSQRPLTQLINARVSWFSLNSWRWTLIWLGFYWGASAVLFAIFFFYYQLVFLFWFVLIGLLVGGTFIILLKQNLGRTVFGELVGILGLTMTAPLAHSVAIGRIQPIGFYVWGLSFLYFASSIFYVKATVQDFVTARARARMAASRATAEGVLRPLPFLQSSERVNPILTRSHIARDASGSGDSPATDELLSTASLILSHPHAAFGCPLPMGEGLGVRGQSKNNDTHAAFMSPCIDFKEPYESLSTRQLCQAYHWGLLSLVGILVICGKLPILTLLAFAPVIVRGLWDSDISQMRLNLRRIGWLEVAYSIIFALFIIWAMRLEMLAR